MKRLYTKFQRFIAKKKSYIHIYDQHIYMFIMNQYIYYILQ